MPATKRKSSPAVHRMLTIDEVANHFGVSSGTIYRMIRAGEFPKGERFGRRLVRWNAARLNRFIENGCRM